MDRFDVTAYNCWRAFQSSCDRGFIPVFGGLAGLPAAMEDRPLRPPSCGVESKVTDPADDFRMPPKFSVDLMAELMEETGVLPTSCDWESDTNHHLPPPTLAAVEVDVATCEISQLLLKIPSDSHRLHGLLHWGLPPSPACPWLRRLQLEW